MTSQLRDVRILPGCMAEFLDAWRGGVLPLRRAFGFTVVAWAIHAEDRFVWVLSHPGSEADFLARDAEYYASAERALLDPDPARWIAASVHAFAEVVADPPAPDARLGGDADDAGPRR